ncbi:MAG TPA: Holliday junction branch migration protein RuvA [Candidatus Limnocylindria bacterium]|nr:Holliday junction branch migration protein RuvA [Candidatus Limnocylindria bacterium]
MIASVRGRIVAQGTDHVVVESGGVGYKVFVPRHPETGPSDEVVLHTHQVTREDGQFLFGFVSREELALFELLIGVSGVGPKAGLAILSVSRPVDVAAAIASGDVAALARAPGVGKKTAERLIVDLRSKVGRLSGGPSLAEPLPDGDEALAALRALGYTQAEAQLALRAVPPAGNASTEERLAAALRNR